MATKVHSICGAVDLLAAVFDKDVSELRKKYSLPLKYGRCLNCGNQLSHNGLYCSDECLRQFTKIPVVCSECGQIFHRSQYKIKSGINKYNQKLFFCSKKCQGRYLGQEYGFKRHPENRKYYTGIE